MCFQTPNFKHPSTLGAVRAEDRLQQDAFFSANASLVDEIAHLGNVLLHPPKEPDAAAGSGKRRGVGCLPDAWTGNSHDYNLTRWAPLQGSLCGAYTRYATFQRACRLLWPGRRRAMWSARSAMARLGLPAQEGWNSLELPAGSPYLVQRLDSLTRVGMQGGYCLCGR